MKIFSKPVGRAVLCLPTIVIKSFEFATAARREFGKWFEPELVEHFIEGLQKAGLAAAGEGGKDSGTQSGD